MISVKPIPQADVWEAFLSHHPEANFLQSWYWGAFHERLNHLSLRTGFYRDDVLVGVMLSVVEPAKRGRYLTVPAGPIIDWQDQELVAAAVSEMRRIASEQRCVFVRVRPQLESSPFSQQLFRQLGFVDAPMHLHAELTSQLDITKTEEELLAQMRKATRYEIKKAQKVGVTITTSSNPSDIQRFYDLQAETAQRQGFTPFSYSFLAEQFAVFAEHGHALLYTAAFEGQVLAQGFIIFYGQEAAYHYGASTLLGRQYPGAYLIQWEAIREAKRRGLQRYNFWGVAAESESEHRFASLSLFKRGFGGQDFAYLHAQDLVINRGRYMINAVVENIRKKLRKV